MKFENTKVFNFEGAIRGMRNPLESWDKSDSESSCEVVETPCNGCKFKNGNCDNYYHIGANDLKLMQTLIKSGCEHRKFMRQIMVSVDITAPLYWWKETDQYRIGVTTNSCSTMHKLASTPITLDCFELTADCVVPILNEYIDTLESMRMDYNKTKNKEVWKALIQMLPESWLQKRTIAMNYENILNMVHQRKNHKLSEWSESFMNWAKSLPYAQELFLLD